MDSRVAVGVLTVVVAVVFGLTQQAEAVPTIPSYDSEFSDKIFYLTRRVFPNFTTLGPAFASDLCEADRPSFVFPRSAIPFIVPSDGSSTSATNDTVTGFTEFDFTDSSNFVYKYCTDEATYFQCLAWYGRYWYSAPTGGPLRLLAESLSPGPSFFASPDFSGFRSGDAPVAYWTGVDTSQYGNARACQNGTSRWASSSYINQPDVQDFAQGASVGTGFVSGKTSWIANRTERCNQTLPLLCMGRSRTPTFKKASFTRLGNIEIYFDLPTNGMNLGSFLCNSTFELPENVEANQLNYLGTCSFKSPDTLVMSNVHPSITPPWFSISPITPLWVTSALNTTGFSNSVRRTIGNPIVRDTSGIFPALLPQNIDVGIDAINDFCNWLYAYDLTPRIIVPRSISLPCETTLNITLENIIDTGRPIVSASLWSNHNLGAGWVYNEGFEGGYIYNLSPIELSTGKVSLDASQWINLPVEYEVSSISLRLREEITFWFTSEEARPCTTSASRTAEVQIFYSSPYPSVTVPLDSFPSNTPIGLSSSPRDALISLPYVVPVRVDLRCIPNLNASSVVYEWTVGFDLRRRLLADDQGDKLQAANSRYLKGQENPLFESTSSSPNLVIPRYTLPSPRFQFSPCPFCYFVAQLNVYGNVNGTNTIIFGEGLIVGGNLISPGLSAISFNTRSSPLVYGVKATLNGDNSVIVDATGTCDPDVAVGACDSVRKFNPSANKPRGLIFYEEAKCWVWEPSRFYQGGSFRVCETSDYENPTEGPSPAPTVTATDSPTVQGFTHAPVTPPPTFDVSAPPPTIPPPVYSGITSFPALLPGVYMFTQRVKAGDYLFPPSEYEVTSSSCRSGLEQACQVANGVTVRILPKLANCIAPQVSSPVVPSKFTIQNNSSTFIQVPISYNGIQAAGGVQWEIYDPAANSFIPLDRNVSNTLIAAPGFINPPTRATLVFPPNSLFEGSSYIFRVTAFGQGPGCTSAVSVRQTVGFLVNRPPSGGVVSVSPQTGQSFITSFTLSTSGWIDDDLPLSFSFELIVPGRSSPISLSAFSTAASLTTRLSSPIVQNNIITVVVTDTLGARNAASSPPITINPLYSAADGTGSLPDPRSLNINPVQDPDGALRTLAALAAGATQTRDIGAAGDQTFLRQWRTEVAQKTIDTVLQTRNVTGGGAGDIRQVSLQVNTLLLGLTSESNLGDGALEGVSNLVVDLVADAQASLIAAALAKGLPAPDAIPITFGSSLLDILSQLSKGIAQGVETLGLRRMLRSMVTARGDRDLQDSATAGYTRSVQNLRASLNSLVSGIMQGYVPGAPIQSFNGVEIEVSAFREARALVGTGSTTLTLGDIKVSLPPSVLDAQFVGANASSVDTVDVALVRFRFNVRELVKDGNLPPGFNRTNVTVSGAIADNFTVEEVTALIFLSAGGSSVVLDPSNLTAPINLTLPLPVGYVLPDSSSGLELVCGAWDTSFGGWSDAGARVVAVDLVARTVTCSSTHASDFAAWNAFSRNLGGGPVGIILAIAIVVVGVMCPLIVLAYIFSMVLAWRKDKKDADGVHAGALLLLTRNKLRLRAKQRKFFQLLRDNAKEPKPLVVDRAKEQQLKEDRAALSSWLKEQNKSAWDKVVPHIVLRWFRALWYDHSLVGVFTRFDPYYTRVQRVTVITAVVTGNLFIASFFFELKTATDLSFGFMFGVVMLAGLVVALPVKIIVRFLFRMTETTTGSTMDRVSQIYRISLIHKDFVPVYASEAEKADIEMILAFREYYLAKTDVSQAQAILQDVKRQNEPVTTWTKLCGFMRLGRSRAPGSVSNARTKSMAAKMGISLDAAETPDLQDLREVEQAVQKAINKQNEAASKLQAACAKAKEEWDKVPRRPNARVETLRKQQSAVMKFAALLYDEVDNGPPRERTKRFKSWFIYVAWSIATAYLLGTLIFTSYWLLAYTSIKPGNSEIQQKDANEVLLAWLLAASLGVIVGLFIAEPLIQLIRFGLMPWCLIRFGTKPVSYDRSPFEGDDDDDEDIEAKEDSKDGQAMIVQVSDKDAVPNGKAASIEELAKKNDEFKKQANERKKGEGQSMTAVAFDTAAEIVEALT